MKQWIKCRNVLAAFGDPAGAKAVLAFLSLHGACAKSITIISNREHGFYRDFSYHVSSDRGLSINDWLHNIEVLVVGTSYPTSLEFDLINATSKAGIPSISFVDHWTNLSARFERDGRRVLPDVIGLVDKRAYDLALIEGLPLERLKIVGNPYYSYLKNWRPHLSRPELLESLGISIHKPYFFYAPEPFSKFNLKEKFGFDEIDGLHLIREAKKEFPKGTFSIIIKGHPNQDHSLFDTDLVKSFDKDIIYIRDGDINIISYYAVSIIGFFSNSLIEASLLGCSIIRPLMLLKSEALDSLSSVLNEAWVDVFSKDEFIKILQTKLNQHKLYRSRYENIDR